MCNYHAFNIHLMSSHDSSVAVKCPAVCFQRSVYQTSQMLGLSFPSVSAHPSDVSFGNLPVASTHRDITDPQLFHVWKDEFVFIRTDVVFSVIKSLWAWAMIICWNRTAHELDFIGLDSISGFWNEKSNFLSYVMFCSPLQFFLLIGLPQV